MVKTAQIEILEGKLPEDVINGISGDEESKYDSWREFVKAVEEGTEVLPKVPKVRKRPDYYFNVDEALDSIDLTFKNYTPSKQAIEFFNIIRLVLGEDPEVPNSKMHYFLVDAIFGNLKRENFPYSKKLQEKLRLNKRKIAIIAARMSAKSTVITAYLPIYVAITGKIPNFGKVMFMVGFGDSQQAGAKVQANTIRDFCIDSAFCKEYFEKMRFTDEECEFIRKGTTPIKQRAFMYKVKGAAGGSVRGIRYRTERPACHVKGTVVTTELGTYPVEEHPDRSEGHFEYVKKVSVCGLPNSELVSADHKYWAKVCNTKQVWDKAKKKLVTRYEESTPIWCEASALTDRHWIGSRIDYSTEGAQSNLTAEHFRHVHISGGLLWRKVNSVIDTEDKYELIPIECNNRQLVDIVGTKHAYETAFGISKNCIIFDDIVKNDADAASPVIMRKLKSMMYADAENALGSKGMLVAVNTPFNKNDPIYSALESGIWTPICLPICERISIDLDESEYTASWPQMHPYEKTMERYSDAYYGGTEKEFMKELMLRISSTDERLIQDSAIRWFSRAVIMRHLSNFTIIATTDLTASTAKKGDYAGIAIWAINANDDKMLIDLALRKMTIQEQYETVFSMVRKWSIGGRVIEVGVEIDGQQQLNVFALEKMMLEKNFYFRFARQKGAPIAQKGIRSKEAGGGKLERLKYMMPDFEKGSMLFAEELKSSPDMKELLEEIKYTTHTAINSQHDDGLDLISQLGLIDYIPPSMDEVTLSQNSNNTSGVWSNWIYSDEESDTNSIIF